MKKNLIFNVIKNFKWFIYLKKSSYKLLNLREEIIDNNTQVKWFLKS